MITALLFRTARLLSFQDKVLLFLKVWTDKQQPEIKQVNTVWNECMVAEQVPVSSSSRRSMDIFYNDHMP